MMEAPREFDIHPDEDKDCCCGHRYGQHVIWRANVPAGACPQIITVDGKRRHCHCLEAHPPTNHHQQDDTFAATTVSITVRGETFTHTVNR